MTSTLLSGKWVGLRDTPSKIENKFSGRAIPLQDDKEILLAKLKSDKYKNKLVGYGKYTKNTPEDLIPLVYKKHFDTHIKPIAEDIETENISLVKNIFSKINDIDTEVQQADKTLDELETAQGVLPSVFEMSNDKFTFVNPLNDFIKNWSYDDKINQNVFEAGYTFLYQDYLLNSSKEDRELLGCNDKPGVPDKCSGSASGPNDKRRLMMKRDGTCEDYRGETYYKCPKLVNRLDPFMTSRTLDLTIPSMGTLYNPVGTERKKSVAGLINRLFFGETTINIRDYLVDFPVDLTINNIPQTVSSQHVYLNLDMTDCGDVEDNSTKRMSVKNEVIMLAEEDDLSKKKDGSFFFIPGNLFKVYEKNMEGDNDFQSTAQIQQKIDNVYKSSTNDKVLKKTKLKLKETVGDLDLVNIRNQILILFSIYRKKGLDFNLSHKGDKAEDINRKIAKELLYLGLFTFFNYLEFTVFKMIKEEVKSSSLSGNLKKNVDKYFNNLLALLRTNTVYLLGYDKTKIDFKNNYGILRGQTDTVIAEKGGNYFRVEDGYKNSKLQNDSELDKFGRNFIFKVEDSVKNDDIVFAYKEIGSGSNKKKELFFTKDFNNVNIDNVKRVSTGPAEIINFSDKNLFLTNREYKKGGKDNLDKGLSRFKGLKYIQKNQVAGAVYPSSGDKSKYNKFDIVGADILVNSFLRYDSTDNGIKNMANFLIGTSKSAYNIKDNERIGFGVLPYIQGEKAEDRNKRNIVIYQLYLQYVMNSIVHIEKNSKYLKHLVFLLGKYLSVNYIKKMKKDFDIELHTIYLAPNDTSRVSKILKFINKTKTEYFSLMKDLQKYLKLYIESDYKFTISKELSEESHNKYVLLLLIARNKLLMFQKILRISYDEFEKKLKPPIYTEGDVKTLKKQIMGTLNGEFEKVKQSFIDSFDEDLELRKKSLELGVYKEAKRFFVELTKDSFDTEQFDLLHAETVLLDDRELIDKLMQLNTKALASKDHCHITNGRILSIATLRKRGMELNKRDTSITLPRLLVPRMLHTWAYDNLAWTKIFDYIGTGLNYTNIMIPISKPLLGDYQLLDLRNFLEPVYENGRYRLRTVPESFQRTSIFQKKIMKNYNHVILVNYDAKKVEDSRTWRALQYKILNRFAGDPANWKDRYEFVRNILTNPTVYQQMVRSIWNDGIIKNSINKKKVPTYVVSFNCLATRINEIIDSI